MMSHLIETVTCSKRPIHISYISELFRYIQPVFLVENKIQELNKGCNRDDFT